MPITEYNDRPYRRNVGILLLAPTGNKIFAGLGNRFWQAPQGGIHAGESVIDAAYRELQEETGLTKHAVQLIATHPEWLTYTYPQSARRPHPEDGILYAGQTQKWLVFRFIGDESEIDLSIETPPVFEDWQWASLESLVTQVAPYKADIYRELASWLVGILK